MVLEAAVSPAASFVTLTYDEEHVPDGGSLFPRDLQLWLKRFREAVGPCRFFAVGEYGDQSWRPHYHVALYGHDRGCGGEVVKTWGKGFVEVGDLTVHSAQYVAGYTVKKMTQVDDVRLPVGYYPEFSRMSRRPGIGAAAAVDMARALSGVAFGTDVPSVVRSYGRSLPLGRYMRERLRKELGFEFKGDSASECREKTQKMFDMFVAAQTPLSYRAWSLEREKQERYNFDGKQAIFKKRGSL